MLVYTGKLIAVGMDKYTAVLAFQVEMLVAAVIAVNVLIAGSGLAVNGIAADNSLIDKAVKLTVNRCSTERSSLSGEKCADSGNISVLVLIRDEVGKKLFLLFCVIS